MTLPSSHNARSNSGHLLRFQTENAEVACFSQGDDTNHMNCLWHVI